MFRTVKFEDVPEGATFWRKGWPYTKAVAVAEQVGKCSYCGAKDAEVWNATDRSAVVHFCPTDEVQVMA